MGLDTSHGCWNGAYSAFARWRDRIAAAAGYEFIEEEGHTVPALDWDRITLENVGGEWDSIPTRTDGTPDALIILLAHSDCDGVIKNDHCALIADRLETLLPNLDGDGGGHVGQYRTKTERFISGLRAAVKEGDDVEFY